MQGDGDVERRASQRFTQDGGGGFRVNKSTCGTMCLSRLGLKVTGTGKSAPEMLGYNIIRKKIGKGVGEMESRGVQSGKIFL